MSNSIHRPHIRPFIVSVCIIIVLAFAMCLITANRERSGIAATFNEVPNFGSILPPIGDAPIAYRYDPRIVRLLTKTLGTTSTFYTLCNKLGLNIIKYEKGFPGSDLVINDEHFAPQGTRVWCGYGKLRTDGRSQVRVFFEPSVVDSTNVFGVLYLHVH